MEDQFSALRTMLDYGRMVADDEDAIEFFAQVKHLTALAVVGSAAYRRTDPAKLIQRVGVRWAELLEEYNEK